MITENIEQYKGVYIFAQQVDNAISLQKTLKQRLLQFCLAIM